MEDSDKEEEDLEYFSENLKIDPQNPRYSVLAKKPSVRVSVLQRNNVNRIQNHILQHQFSFKGSDFEDQQRLSILEEIAQDLKDNVVSKDRTYLLQNYSNCFLGTEAVQYLISSGHANSVEQAIQIGNELMSIGSFSHAVRLRAFENKNYFYQFNLETHPIFEDSTFTKELISPNPSPKKHIVIIGGGFAGIFLVQSLSNCFKITLIDPKRYWESTVMIPKVMVEPAQQGNIQIEYEKIFSYLKMKKNVTFIEDTVTTVEDDYVKIQKSNQPIKFDFLVICSGSSYSAPIKVSSSDNEKKTLIDNSVFHSLKTRREILSKTAQEIENSNHVLVLGGGPVGVEIASEILSKFPKKQVTLATSSSCLLSNCPKEAGKVAQSWFQSHKNASLVFNEKFDHIPLLGTSNIYQGDKGTKIQADLVLKMVGITPNTQFMNSKYLNERKFIKVTDNLKLENGPSNIFAIGDCTNFPEEKMAYTAHKQAIYIIKILLQNIEENNNNNNNNTKETNPIYSPTNKTMLIGLGPNSGISILNGSYIPSPGFILGKTKDNLNKYTLHQTTGCYPDIPFTEKKCFTCRFLGTFVP